MKDRLKFFFQLAVFWLVYFTIGRLIFLLYEYPLTFNLSLKEIILPLLLGTRMDAAMTGYWLLITGLLLTASPFIKPKSIATIHGIYIGALLLFSSIVIVADIELYKHWGFRINSTPLMYIGEEAAGTVDKYVLIVLLLIFVIYFSLFQIWYWKIIHPKLRSLDVVEKKFAPLWLAITVALIIPIRSSFSVAPLNTGVVYFHKTKTFPNHAGINPVWNFLNSVLTDKKSNYPEDFYPGYEPDLNELFDHSNQTQKLFTIQKPNVILIIMESFTSKIIGSLGGLKNITPQFDSLNNHGLAFTNFYASGDRTDKGLISILSGYPAQPRTSIIKYPDKTQNLPYLSKAMQNLGYQTSFLYGGDVDFANMNSYLTQGAFENITDVDDFEDDVHTSKWGVADHLVFNRLLAECDTAINPFFKVMLSLSSHEPFEVPMSPVFEGNDERAKFLNACYYADKSLGEFIRRAQNKQWWNNTIVIITADHGHRFPDPEELKDKDRFRIPMVWTGGALAKIDSTISTISSQTDIANTLLSQLESYDTNFIFSKNILDKKIKPFAVYIFNNGYGYVSPTNENIYDFDLKNYLKTEGEESETRFGKAYMQKLFHDYNSR
jgi:phosphoglycerol transferase MdoB-like AlkP superfamily enzyme